MAYHPELRTTYGRRRKHYSVDLAKDADDVGRTGRTLCGEQAQDEEETNRYVGTMWGGAGPVSVADLPECKRCARKLAAIRSGA